MNTIVLSNQSLKSYIIKAHKLHGGVQVIFRFPNNYGASVVKHSFSYGNAEMAIIQFFSVDNEDWKIVYDTPIASDVIGMDTVEEMETLLLQIKSL